MVFTRDNITIDRITVDKMTKDIMTMYRMTLERMTASDELHVLIGVPILKVITTFLVDSCSEGTLSLIINHDIIVRSFANTTQGQII